MIRRSATAFSDLMGVARLKTKIYFGDFSALQPVVAALQC